MTSPAFTTIKLGFFIPTPTPEIFSVSVVSANVVRPLQNLRANHLLNYPTPASLTYNWSFGSLVGLFFARQIVTGVFLARHYTPHVTEAFASVEHIRTDVYGGSVVRYFHANGGSAIFILRYLHIARNLYYQSYFTRATLWYSGLVIFLRRRATAFIGYVLPWGQRSFWGATVITNLVTAIPVIGEDIAYWVWGGFSINNATLTRFFSAHYLLPFRITGLIATHLTLLHVSGSSDPLSLSFTNDKISFHPYFSLKDSFILVRVLLFFGFLLFYTPNALGHADNFLAANPLVTPAHIVPEWYFTPFYAILRACPNKGGGAIGRFAAILVLFFVPALVSSSTNKSAAYGPHTLTHKIFFWLFMGVFLTLRFLGSRAAAEPYVSASKAFTALYFVYLLLVLPILSGGAGVLFTGRKPFFTGAIPRFTKNDPLVGLGLLMLGMTLAYHAGFRCGADNALLPCSGCFPVEHAAIVCEKEAHLAARYEASAREYAARIACFFLFGARHVRRSEVLAAFAAMYFFFVFVAFTVGADDGAASIGGTAVCLVCREAECVRAAAEAVEWPLK